MIELSSYVFEALREDKEFILNRGRNKDDAVQVLVLSPAVRRPALESLKRLEHEYSQACSMSKSPTNSPLPREQLSSIAVISGERCQ